MLRRLIQNFDEVAPIEFRSLFIAAIVVALAAHFAPFYVPQRTPPMLLWSLVLSLVFLWCRLLFAAIHWHRRRGLLLLLTALVSLYWPIGLILLARACRQNANA